MLFGVYMYIFVYLMVVLKSIYRQSELSLILMIRSECYTGTESKQYD